METKTDNRYKGKYVVFNEMGMVRYRLKASNGEGLIVSEPYANLKACKTGIETLKKNVETSHISITKDKHDLWSFQLITMQGRVLAQSANYKTEKSVKNAVESFKKFVSTDVIVEDDSEASHYEVFNKIVSPQSKGKYVIEEDEYGFSYTLKASNGAVIATSQVYKSYASCKEALENFRELAYTGDFYIFEDKNGKFQFKLYSKQKRLVMAGEVYDDKNRAMSVVESIKRFAKEGKLVE